MRKSEKPAANAQHPAKKIRLMIKIIDEYICNTGGFKSGGGLYEWRNLTGCCILAYSRGGAHVTSK